MSAFERVRQLQGRDFGPGESVTVSQEMIDSFAAATLDRQWIHVDSERAERESPFGGTVAHGMLSLSLIPPLTISLLGLQEELVINYGLDRVRFPAPLPAGSRARVSVSVAEVTEAASGARLTVDARVDPEGGDKPVCIARLLLYVQDT